MDEPNMQDAPVTKGHDTMLAAISYIGPLVIASYLLGKDDPFVRFHVKQGIVLFIAEVAIWVLMSMLWFLSPIWNILNIILAIFSIVGLVYAIQGKEKELPVVKQFVKHVKI